jgi:glyoxylase-like metal-dependent hydrolase (beta-lactamase superfamily II)
VTVSRCWGASSYRVDHIHRMTNAWPIAPHTTLVDLEYLGQHEFVAVCLLESDAGIAIVDPGPSVSLPSLCAALALGGRSIADVTAILVTHIHLDHAGVTGTLLKQNPRIAVYVHERGAPHMANPVRLLESATRIYGDKMDYLWGEFLAVPESNLHPLKGGETIRLGSRSVDVAYTPGHAWHHVSYLDRETGIAFVGDTVGERLPSGSPAIPTTPPPDIHLETWHDSLRRIRDWGPSRLFLTHFGDLVEVHRHFVEHERALGDWAERVRRSLDEPGDDEARAVAFATQALADLRSAATPEAAEKIYFDSIRDCWYGLARYWRKKATT